MSQITQPLINLENNSKAYTVSYFVSFCFCYYVIAMKQQHTAAIVQHQQLATIAQLQQNAL